MSESSQPKLDPREVELIHLLIDDEGTPQQRAEARNLVAMSTEAREFYESMGELAKGLDAMPWAESPGLKNVILAGLRSRKGSASVASFAEARSRRRLLLGLTWAAAAVLVIAVGVHRLILSRDHRNFSPEQAAGSMAPANPGEWPLLARLSVEEATLAIRQSGDQYALGLSVRGPGMVTVRWDDQKLVLRDRPDGADVSEPGEVSVASDRAPVVILQRRTGVVGSAAVTILLDERELLRTSILLD